MSDPINIPTRRPDRRGVVSDASPFPENDGPYMGYTETYENGHIYHAVSSGSGKFVTVGRQCELPFFSFVVQKDRVTRTTTISIKSRDLKQVISGVVGDGTVPPFQWTIDFDTVLGHYDALRLEYERISRDYSQDDVAKEMRLLVDDIVLERSLYDGVDIDQLRQQGIISITLLQDIHQRNMDLGISDLEDCFSVGESAKKKTVGYLELQNTKIAELALTGKLDALRGFCEPLVRSREIKVFYEPEIILRILDNGFLDVYEYILDLIERTRPLSEDVPDADYIDITYDPLCIAIRLGHYPTVQSLVDSNKTFIGYIAEDIAGGTDRVFTPLLAAVLWERLDIIQLLLRSGPMYHARLFQADQLAADMGLMDVSQALRNLPKPSTSAFEAMSAKYPTPKAPQLYSTGISSPNYVALSPSPHGDKSISGISSALHGSGRDPWDEGFESAIATPAIPSWPVAPSIAPQQFVSPKDLSYSAQVFSPAFSPEMNPPVSPKISDGTPRYLRPFSMIQPPGDSPIFIDYTNSYKLRRRLGCASMLRLQKRCRKIKQACRQHGCSGGYEDVSHRCTDSQTVWQPGFDCLRNIMRNQVPSGLIEILQTLMVADALICQVPNAREQERGFVDDLRRWKFLLREHETDMDMFDEIVCTAWGIKALPTTTLPGSDQDLLRFGELAEGLISHADIKPPDPCSHGIRLREVQRQIKSQQKDLQPVERLTLSNPDIFTGSKRKPPDIKVVDPEVVLLLQSVAFNILFTTSSSIQDIEDNDSSQQLLRSPASMNRSCAIVEDYLSFESKNGFSYDSGIGLECSVKSFTSPWMQGMGNASDGYTKPQPSGTSIWTPKSTEDIPELLYPYMEGLDTADTPSMMDLDEDGTAHIEDHTADLLPSRSFTSITKDLFDMAVSWVEEPSSAHSSQTEIAGKFSQSTQDEETHLSPSNMHLSLETPSSQSPFGARKEGITCDACGKEFSNKGNRNKHKNTACPKLSKETFLCRYYHLGCSSELTTEWYRGTHEEQRCKFNPNSELNRKREGR